MDLLDGDDLLHSVVHMTIPEGAEMQEDAETGAEVEEAENARKEAHEEMEAERNGPGKSTEQSTDTQSPKVESDSILN